MWIKALELFRVEGADPSTWKEDFSHHPLAEPVGSNPNAMGFVTAPEGEDLVDELEGRYAFVTALASRNLPAESIDREAAKRLKVMYPDPDAEIGKAERDEVWNKARDDMMPKAPILEIRTPAVFCERAGLLYVFGSSKKGVEAMQMTVRHALGSFMAVPLRPRDSAGVLMTRWLTGEPPEILTIGDSMTLQIDDVATTAFRNQELRTESVLQHIADGAMVKKLDLVWREELAFELNADGQLSKIGPIGCKMNAKLAFVHWPEIMTRLPQFAAEIMALLGEKSMLDPDQIRELLGDDPDGDAAPSNLDRAADEGGAEHEQQQGSCEPFVPVVLPPEDGDQALVHRMLDAVQQRMPLDGIVIMRRPINAYRAMFTWAQANDIQVTLMDEPTADPADMLMPPSVSALVVGADDPVARTVVAAAKERGVRVINMQPTR